MINHTDSFRRNAYRTGCIILTIIFIFVFSRWFLNRRTFSSIKWKNHPETRNCIVADLLKKYRLVGMNEQDVVLLLGNEDEKGSQQTTFKGDRTYYPPESTIVYYLGQDLLDGRWLKIKKKNGVVQKVSIGIT